MLLFLEFKNGSGSTAGESSGFFLFWLAAGVVTSFLSWQAMTANFGGKSDT